MLKNILRNTCLLISLSFISFYSYSRDAGDFYVNGIASGSVVETNNKIIINGATIIANGGGESSINIGKNVRKEVIISNVRIISNNQNLNSNGHDQAGVVVIDNSKSKSKVLMRNVGIASRNINVSSVSLEKNVCSGVVCYATGTHDASSSVGVYASGNTNITAAQGVRPDYRKIR